jgi:hypothetical protein
MDTSYEFSKGYKLRKAYTSRWLLPWPSALLHLDSEDRRDSSMITLVLLLMLELKKFVPETPSLFIHNRSYKDNL